MIVRDDIMMMMRDECVNVSAANALSQVNKGQKWCFGIEQSTFVWSTKVMESLPFQESTFSIVCLARRALLSTGRIRRVVAA